MLWVSVLFVAKVGSLPQPHRPRSFILIMKREPNLNPEILNARHLLGRRDFLQVGMLGGLGLALPELLRTEARAAQKHYESKEGQAKSVIHIFLPGGMAHQESFDPKPYAPLEYRGPSGNIGTKLTGVRFNSISINLLLLWIRRQSVIPLQ